MEEKRFMSGNFETPQLNQDFQIDGNIKKKCLSIAVSASEQSSPFSDENNLKINASEALISCFSSDNKENIASNNNAISDESTVCAMKPFNYSDLKKCEKKLLESSSDDEKSFVLAKKPVDSGKLLQLTEKLKFHNDTISTPPSALREQISMLRKEMKEAYEFHDLEIQVLKEERKEDPENYAQLIEKYSTLLELYSTLKSEYENYRKDQEKIKDELQSKTVDCLASLCSQIETSDNSFNSASFVSFSTDLKCSTMIDNFTEKEATLLHYVTIQTKDPLSDTDIFINPKLTPCKNINKFFPQNLNQKPDHCDSANKGKLIDVEIALSDKTKEVEKFEERLLKIEDMSALLQSDFQRISLEVLNENKTLKQNLFNKSEQLNNLTQKLFTEIISLNPDLVDSLVDFPGTKLLPILIETIMERCKSIENKLAMKFGVEKLDLETKVNTLEEENKNLNAEISSQASVLQELKKSHEKQLLEFKNTILTRDEEIQILKTYDFNLGQMQDDLARAKENLNKLEARLSLSEGRKREVEDKYQILEQTSDSLRFDLEKIKELCETSEKENEKLKDRLSEIATENDNLKEACEQMKRHLSENDDVISSQDLEIENLKNQELKPIKAALTEAEEIILKMKAELFKTEGEKLSFEKRCLELENTNSTLQTVISTKDSILNELEGFKSSYQSEWENMKQQIKEKERLISDLRVELCTIKQTYSVEVENTKTLTEKICSHTSEFVELEKSYRVIENKLSEAENKIQMQDEKIRVLELNDGIIRQVREDLAREKEQVARLEAQLSLSEGRKKEVEDKYQILEQTSDSLRFDLEKIKELCETSEKENEKLKERLSEISTENDNLKEVCEQMKGQLFESDDVISSRDLEIENLKNQELKPIKAALTEAEEIILKMKAELFKTEGEKLSFEKRCLELENTNSTLQTVISTKDSILNELEGFKSSCQSEWENMKQQIKEKERLISDLRVELDTIKEKYSLETENTKRLKAEIKSHASEFLKLQNSYGIIQNKLSDAENKIQMQDEEIQILKTHDFNVRHTREDFARAKENLNKLEAQLSLSEGRKKEVEDKYQILEQTSDSLRFDLEKIKELCETSEKENEKLKERLSEISTENDNLKEVCEQMKRQLSESDDVISSRDLEIENLKNQELKPIKAALTEAEEIILKVKAELLSMESEKLNFEKRCLELENTNSTLQTMINTKDAILKELEGFKSSYQSEWENMKQQIKEEERLISNLRVELDTIKEKYSLETENTKRLKGEIKSHASEFVKLQNSYGIIQKKLSEAEYKIQMQDEKIRVLELNDGIIRQMQDDLASGKEIIGTLEAKLLLAECEKKELENRCQGLEEKCHNFCLNLERNESEYINIDFENENFKKLIHQKNAEFEFEILFEILEEGLEKSKLLSVGDFPKIIKKAMVHVKKLQSRAAELKEENEKLDEECDSYAKVIKDLKKEAAVEWKKNKEKTQAFEEEILRLTEMKKNVEAEKKELVGKIWKLEEECQRLKNNITAEGRNCGCGVDFKKVNELKRTILVKEQKLLELQDMEAQNNSYKSQIDYLKNALDKERKKINEEREKNKKLQNELNEANQIQKTDNKKTEQNQILEELRMRGSTSGGVVGEIVDKEKMRKLSKDVGVLKEICRARYAEIKRLEAENAALKNSTPKNSNQTDSPIRIRGYNARPKSQIAEKWRTGIAGKENRAA